MLARLGCAALAAPVIETRALDEPAPPGPFDALIVTSAKAAARLADLPEETRALRVFAVGPRTARALGANGSRDVFASGGDAQALIRDISRLAPPPARLLHVAGRDRKPEPAGGLRAMGYDVSVWTAYEARAVRRLPESARAALADGAIAAALHYSPRSARILLRLVAEAGASQAFARIAHVVISPDVAAILREAGLRRVSAAPEPNEKAMLRVLLG
ncbi:MAG: uroporphyrinogen-III synthase [Salinarimonadaceae bacterium]|nr:MAG: uroporphyrinogen-III synthase [Salinarimonadaceae bacterium]